MSRGSGAVSFQCRECGARTRVLETRTDGDTTLRIRECEQDHKFLTREVFERDCRVYPAARQRKQKATA